MTNIATNRKRRFTKIRDRAKIFNKTKGRCSICGKKLKKGWHTDHVIPFSKGGKTNLNNAQALCPKCNKKKVIKLCLN